VPIRIKTTHGLQLVEQTAFAAEVHLQEILAQAPGLLRQAGESPFALVMREFNMREAGSLDILLVSAEGLPVAVEVKLQANSQSRREVVAQAVDYLSALATYTNDELDEATNGQLSAALRSFEQDTPEDEFERRWAAVGANLRAGLARVLVAVDAPTPGLERIIRFLAEASDLDIQLVAIERYQAAETGEVVVPRFLVSASSTARRSTPTSTQEPKADLLEVVAAYNRIAPSDLQAVGNAPHYRQVKPPEWPTGFRVHYEFSRTNKGIEAEVHLEADAGKPVADILRPFAGQTLVQGTPPLSWDQTWSSGKGRLMPKFLPGVDPVAIAKTMVALVQLTRGPIGARLRELAGSQALS
jgi:hypothetical protein